MPEGPTILHLRNQLLPFKNKIVKEAGGYGPMLKSWMNGKKLKDIRTWGKHLLFVFANGTVSIHLGLFGDVLVNERKKVNRSFFLAFADGEINGYVVKATKLTASPEETYDWRTDILSDDFDPAYVKSLLKVNGGKYIEAVLMDQQVFTGSGNIIRNEALYQAGIHPLSVVEKIPSAKISKLIKSVTIVAGQWYQQMEKGKKMSFAVYRREHADDGSEVTMKIITASKRKVFFSENRQKLYQ
jgi:endonuclease-8